MSKHITIEMWAEAGSFDRIANAGDSVDEDVAMQFLNSMPPITMISGDSGIVFFQNSEPYSHERVGNTRFCAATYATFERKDGVWYYLGNCFRGEKAARA